MSILFICDSCHVQEQSNRVGPSGKFLPPEDWHTVRTVGKNRREFHVCSMDPCWYKLHDLLDDGVTEIGS